MQTICCSDKGAACQIMTPHIIQHHGNELFLQIYLVRCLRTENNDCLQKWITSLLSITEKKSFVACRYQAAGTVWNMCLNLKLCYASDFDFRCKIASVTSSTALWLSCLVKYARFLHFLLDLAWAAGLLVEGWGLTNFGLHWFAVESATLTTCSAIIRAKLRWK